MRPAAAEFFNNSMRKKTTGEFCIMFEFACPYQWTCAQTQKIKNLCLGKMGGNGF